MVLTNHNFVEKQNFDFGDSRKRNRPGEFANAKNHSGLSQLVLIVNNWGFVRDTQHDNKVRPCTPSDFQVQLKLSSSAFRTAANPDCEFPFDKQAANFPYDSFEQVMKSLITKKFVRDVKNMYEETEGVILNDSQNDCHDIVEDEEEEEEEDGVNVPLATVYRSQKRSKK